MAGVHGSLIELFECGPELNAAVEVVGGGSLFNMVVSECMHGGWVSGCAGGWVSACMHAWGVGEWVRGWAGGRAGG